MKIIFILSLLLLVSALDVQRLIEFENTLNYTIKLVKQKQLDQFDANHFKQCVSLTCCICGQKFKYNTGSAIHYRLYHHQQLQNSNEVAILFDNDVPSEERYEFCQEFLKDREDVSPQVRQEVCLVISWDMYTQPPWVQVIKYLLYAVVGFALMIYYSDLAKPWN